MWLPTPMQFSLATFPREPLILLEHPTNVTHQNIPPVRMSPPLTSRNNLAVTYCLVLLVIFLLCLLFSRSVVANSLGPHGLQHTRLPCPLLSPRVCWNSCPLHWWCHWTILSSVDLFSSCFQSFPASGSFPRSELFTSGGQNIGVSASALPMTKSVLLMNEHIFNPIFNEHRSQGSTF